MKPLLRTVQPSADWHALANDDVLQRMASSQRGLSLEEAERRLEQYGANRLAEMPPWPAWRRFVDQFKSLLIVILLVTAALALLIGDVKDMVVILVVVVFNAVLGFLPGAPCRAKPGGAQENAGLEGARAARRPPD